MNILLFLVLECFVLLARLSPDSNPPQERPVGGVQSKSREVLGVEQSEVVFKSLRPCNAVVISPDGKFIACGGEDRILRIYTNSGREIAFVRSHEAPIFAIAFSSDGHRVASAGPERIVLPPGVTPFVPNIAIPFSVKLDEANQNVAHTGPGLPNAVSSSKIASGRLPISRTGIEEHGKPTGGVVMVWEVATGELLRAQRGYDKPISRIAYSDDGTWLSSFDNGFYLDIRHSSTGRPRLALHRDGISRKYGEGPWVFTSFSGTTLRLVCVAVEVGAHEPTIELYDTFRSRIRVIHPIGLTQGIWTVAMRPDGKTFTSGGRDGSLVEWDFETGAVVRHFPAPQESRPVQFLMYSPDGKRIVSGDDDGGVRLWDAGSGRILQTWKAHGRPVRAIAFLSGGLRVVSGGYYPKNYKKVPKSEQGDAEPVVVRDLKVD